MTVPTPARRPADDLVAVGTETSRLIETLTRLDDAAMAAPSACAGWTRGHVTTHLARNADALGRVTRAALTGEPVAMYPTPEARDAEIDEGSGRPAAVQVDDLAQASSRYAQCSQDLVTQSPRLTHVTVEMRGGRTVPALSLPFLRLRELVIHHVDLDLGPGHGFPDLPGDLQLDLLRHELTRVTAQPAAPVLRLVTDEGDDLRPPRTATHTLRGPRAALLGWITRGTTDEVAADRGDLPTLPFGG